MPSDSILDKDPVKIITSDPTVSFSQKCANCGHSRASHLVPAARAGITVHAVSACQNCKCEQFTAFKLEPPYEPGTGIIPSLEDN